MPSIRRALLSICVLFILGMVACAPPNLVIPPPKTGEVHPDDGALTVSVTSNSAKLGPLATLGLARISPEGKTIHTYSLQAAPSGQSRDTSVFMAALPPGTYRVSWLGWFHGHIEIGAHSGTIPGRFNLQAGCHADLGRLIITAVNGRYLIGRSASQSDNRDLIEAIPPSMLPRVKVRPGGGWLEKMHESDRVADLASFNPVGVHGLIETRDGTLYAGSRMGQLLMRGPDIPWKRLDTGRPNALLSLAQDANGDLIAVGDFLSIYRIDANRKPNRLSPGNLPPGHLFLVAFNPDLGWVVAHQSGTTISFFRSPQIDKGAWTLLHREIVKDSAWSGRNQHWAISLPSGIVFGSSFGGLKRLKATGELEPVKLPCDCNITEINFGTEWSLLSSPGGGLGGIFANLYRSPDEGRTWMEVTPPTKTPGRAALHLPEGKTLLQGGFATGELYLSEDFGMSWKKILEKFQGTSTLIPTRQGDIIHVDEGQNNPFDWVIIERSRDLGRTWKLEYTNYIDIPDKPAKEAPAP